MTWNYRLFQQDVPESAEGSHLFFVGECYYDDDQKPEMCSTMDNNELTGTTPKEVREVYDMMAEAFKQPVIELDRDGNFK